jgi:3-dehydroquinate synthase
MGDMQVSKHLIVQSSKFPYTVRFKEHFESVLRTQVTVGDAVMIDANVFKLYKKLLSPVFMDTNHIVIEPSEKHKSYQGVEPFIDRLIKCGFRRNNRLFAIGGGITQDITAFCASILFRGVDWIFFPTTLLAQCDSCIGSKTSINFGEYKNQIGGFYPPKEIVIDLQFLDTLSPLDLRSGMGEMLHYYLISGEEDFELILREYNHAFLDKNVLSELIYHSLDFKRSYVERDEFDQGPRNVFNYGHSFGHAIETLTGYSIPHGIAVCIGMDIANFLSMKLGHINRELYLRIRSLLVKNWGDTQLPDISLDDFLSVLKKDKKAIGSQINVILTKGLGQMFKTPLSASPEVVSWLSDYLKSFNSSMEVTDYA